MMNSLKRRRNNGLRLQSRRNLSERDQHLPKRRSSSQKNQSKRRKINPGGNLALAMMMRSLRRRRRKSGLHLLSRRILSQKDLNHLKRRRLSSQRSLKSQQRRMTNPGGNLDSVPTTKSSQSRKNLSLRSTMKKRRRLRKRPRRKSPSMLKSRHQSRKPNLIWRLKLRSRQRNPKSKTRRRRMRSSILLGGNLASALMIRSLRLNSNKSREVTQKLSIRQWTLTSNRLSEEYSQMSDSSSPCSMNRRRLKCKSQRRIKKTIHGGSLALAPMMRSQRKRLKHKSLVMSRIRNLLATLRLLRSRPQSMWTSKDPLARKLDSSLMLGNSNQCLNSQKRSLGENLKTKDSQGENHKRKGSLEEDLRTKDSQGENHKRKGNLEEDLRTKNSQGINLKRKESLEEDLRTKGSQGKNLKIKGNLEEDLRTKDSQGGNLKRKGNLRENLKRKVSHEENLKRKARQEENLKKDGDHSLKVVNLLMKRQEQGKQGDMRIKRQPSTIKKRRQLQRLKPSIDSQMCDKYNQCVTQRNPRKRDGDHLLVKDRVQRMSIRNKNKDLMAVLPKSNSVSLNQHNPGNTGTRKHLWISRKHLNQGNSHLFLKDNKIDLSLVNLKNRSSEDILEMYNNSISQNLPSNQVNGKTSGNTNHNNSLHDKCNNLNQLVRLRCGLVKLAR